EATVRGKDNPFDPPLVPLERMDFPAARRVPDADRPTVAAGGQEPAVGADGQAGEPAVLAGEGSGQGGGAVQQPAGHAPGLDVGRGPVALRDVGVSARGVEEAAVGAEGHAGYTHVRVR